MRNYQIDNRKGFEVLHNSETWRMAVHAYDREVNSLEAFQNWGVHENSEEAFVLLQGQAWLVIGNGQEEDACQISPLNPLELLLIEQGERHAVILKEGSCVLIMENRDMSQSHTIPVSSQVKEAVSSIIKLDKKQEVK